MHSINTLGICIDYDLELDHYFNDILDLIAFDNAQEAIDLFNNAADSFQEEDWSLVKNYCETRIAGIDRDKMRMEVYKENNELRLRLDALEKQIKEMNGTI